MPDGVLVVDGRGRIARANDNAYRLLTVPEGTLAGTSIAEFGDKLCPSSSAIDIQWKEQFEDKLGELLRGEAPHFSIAIRGEKSKVLQFRTSSIVGLSKDTVFVVRDITLESQLDRMKSEFVSTAAHQLKTPLASIYGFSELLAANKVPEASRPQVYASIHGQAKQLSALLSDLLDLARIEARASNTANRKDCSISYLLKKAREFNSKIENRIDIIPCNSDVVVHGDEKLIVQAIYNLLDNAAKYSARDSLISVATRVAADESSVSISVSDTGIGMSPQQLEQAFQRFFRAHPDSGVPGTGLGLSFVKEVVEMHGGSVSIASHIEVGTCVTIRFPVRQLPRRSHRAGGDNQ
ncbi:Sensor histidine kinase ResE [Ralstonia chuxiongensis]|nr:Sensor histidine kinase ResE [Ralstonia chuxiongensis]